MHSQIFPRLFNFLFHFLGIWRFLINLVLIKTGTPKEERQAGRFHEILKFCFISAQRQAMSFQLFLFSCYSMLHKTSTRAELQKDNYKKKSEKFLL